MSKIQLDLEDQFTLKVTPQFLKQHLIQQDGRAYLQYKDDDAIPLYQSYSELVKMIEAAERS